MVLELTDRVNKKERLLKIVLNNYLKGYNTAYERAKHDPLSKVKMDYEAVKEWRDSL